MINTYFESSLHKALKAQYSCNYRYKTETELPLPDGSRPIFDIVTDSGAVIEIQTRNPSLLSKKVKGVLDAGLAIKIVNTLVFYKNILTYDEEGALISKRRSPKKEGIYSVFRGLTKLYPYLLDKNFTLEVLLIESNELRKRVPLSYNHIRARHKTNYQKIDKTLVKIIESTLFKTVEDYLALIPDTNGAPFCIKDFPCPAKDARFATWVLLKMGLITVVKKVGNMKYYSVFKGRPLARKIR